MPLIETPLRERYFANTALLHFCIMCYEGEFGFDIGKLDGKYYLCGRLIITDTHTLIIIIIRLM